MEHFFLNMSTISHHSFMRWSKDSARNRKEEKPVTMVFDPCSFDEDSIERDFMVTAFSA